METLLRGPGYGDLVRFASTCKAYREETRKWELLCLTSSLWKHLKWSRSVAQAAAQRVATVRPLRGIAFLRALVRLAAIDGVVVAGSAALYLECIRAGRNCDWFPGDIDCWVDYRYFGTDPEAARRAARTVKLVNNAVVDVTGGVLSSSVTKHLLLHNIVDGRVATDDKVIRPNTPACRALCDTVTTLLTEEMCPSPATDSRWQDRYTSKVSLDTTNVAASRPDPYASESMAVDLLHSQAGKISVILSVPKPCVCGDHEDCKLCDGDTFGWMPIDASSVPCPVPPHHGFDLDIVSVALVPFSGGGLAIDRAPGCFAPYEVNFDDATFTPLLHSKLRFVGVPQVVLDMLTEFLQIDPSMIIPTVKFPEVLANSIRRRTARYLERGWKRVVVRLPSPHVGSSSEEWENVTIVVN